MKDILIMTHLHESCRMTHKNIELIVYEQQIHLPDIHHHLKNGITKYYISNILKISSRNFA